MQLVIKNERNSNIAVSGVLTNPNTTHGAVFILSTLAPCFKKVLSATENARSIWTVGPNAQDVCVFTTYDIQNLMS